MKRILGIILLALLIPVITYGDNYRNIWYATSTHGGGTGALDAVVSGVSINANDVALVKGWYWYKAVNTGQSEVTPYIIAPDDVGGSTTRWQLMPISGRTEYIIVSSPDSVDDPRSLVIHENTSGTTFVVTNAVFKVDSKNSSPVAGVTLTVASGASQYAWNYKTGTSLWAVTIDGSGSSSYVKTYASGSSIIQKDRPLIMNFGEGSSAGQITITLGGYLEID